MNSWRHAADLLKYVQINFHNPTHLNYYKNGSWHAISSLQVIEEIRYLTLGLVSLGVEKGECIGLISIPSPRWLMINFAIAMSGAVLVPLFPNISEENFLFEVKQTGLKTIFVQESDSLSYFKEHKKLFNTIISLGESPIDFANYYYQQILENGKALDIKDPKLYTELESLIREDDLMAIVYTSGTTGIPKGVEHTHKSLIQHLNQQPIDIDPLTTRYLNVLPLAHIFGYTINLIVFGFGGSLYYWDDPKQFAVACRMIHPTLLALVPRILEKIYIKILSGIQQAGYMKRHIGQWAFDLANDEHESYYNTLMHPIADRVLYHTLRDNMGGSIKLVISGGAALDPHLNHFFRHIGIEICEGWGLTEGCPICVNHLLHNKVGTVGPPFKQLQLRISTNGEVLVKGTAMMRGYYKLPEETQNAIDVEGWLHTGDKGVLDEEGFLTIKGRIKEMFKTSTGEYVVPLPIEQALCRAPLIESAMVIADGKKFTSCLLFANTEVLESLKKSAHQENLTDEAFLNSHYIQNEMKQLLQNINQHLNHWEKIQAYRWITEVPSIDKGELTPSMKLKREVIMHKYKSLINSIYQEVATV